MTVFQYLRTVFTGPDSHMIGLGDLWLHETGSGSQLFGASAAGGGVLVREVEAGLAIRDAEDFTPSVWLDAPRKLQVVDLDGASVLLATGRTGTMIEGWEITADGLLGAARPLTLIGGSPGALLALDETWLEGQHLFATASRHAAGVQIWTRAGDTLQLVNQTGPLQFLGTGAVQALSLAHPGGVPHVLALDVQTHALTGFSLGAGGQLGAPNRLDLRDGLYIGTPTHLEVVQMGDASFAILGAAGSSSIAVVALAPDGQMWVTDQVNDTVETRFQNVSALDVLDANGQVYVLTGGVDTGLSLLSLTSAGRLIHLGSISDEQRDMALQDVSDVEMIWRDGGLDIFVSGEVLPGQTVSGRGITQLRVEGDGLLPNVPVPSTGLVHIGTHAADLFIIDGSAPGERVTGFELGRDRLDLSGLGLFYSMDDLQFTPTSTGAVIRLNEAEVTIVTADGRQLDDTDFTFADLSDLWHVSGVPPATPAQGSLLIGRAGPNLLEGQGGDDTLLGEPRDNEFDAISAQVFRLYQATLDRAPDVAGLITWVGRFQNDGMELLQAADRFTNSREFRQIYGETETSEFVTLLYNNVLGRGPDPTGFATWMERLSSGGMDRAEAVARFSESAEFRGKTAADALAFSSAGLQAGFSDDVFRFYQATLGRQPDPGGFSDWTERLTNGVPLETAVERFTNSREFRSTYGDTDNPAFVTLLYNNVLTRNPDPTGLAHWTGRLDRGDMDRAQIVMSFSQSAEFVRKSEPALKAWMLEHGQDDVLDGGGGDDILMGGLLSDTFIFRQSAGGDHVVVDLEPWDRLEFLGFGYDHLADLTEHLGLDGRDTVFTDQDVSIRFMWSNPADFDAVDIGF